MITDAVLTKVAQKSTYCLRRSFEGTSEEGERWCKAYQRLWDFFFTNKQSAKRRYLW